MKELQKHNGNLRTFEDAGWGCLEYFEHQQVW